MKLIAFILFISGAAMAADNHWTNSPSTGYVAGDTNHFWGTFTNSLTITNSGTQANPITFYFEPGASFTKGRWVDNSAAINWINKSNLVIDGGNNGLIQNTSNGTGLTSSNSSIGIYGQLSSFVVIKNLVITNIYRRLTGSADQNREGYPIVLDGSSITVSNCTVSDGDACITYSAGAVTQSNVFFVNNRLLDFNHGYNIGVGNTNAYMTNLVISGNYIEPGLKWSLNSSQLHTDGIIILNNSYDPTSIISGFFIHNNTFGSNFGTFTTAAIFVDLASPQRQMQNLLIYNNLFLAGSNNWSNGFIEAAGSNSWVVNNTCVGSSGNSFAGTNAFFYNNLMTGGSINVTGWAYDWQTNYATNDVFVLTNYCGGVWSDFNIIEGASAYQVSVWDGVNGGSLWLSGILSGLSNWQTWYNNNRGYPVPIWNTTHADPHSTSSAPVFSPGTYIPSTSDTVSFGKGTNLSFLFTTDAAGKPRPATGNWTIGAFEPNTINVSLGNATIRGATLQQ